LARLPYVDPAQAPPGVREALEALPPLNVFRMLAHAETAFRPALRLGAAILTQLELDPRLRELAILRVARLSGAEYEWVQHVAIGRALQVSEEQIAALERGDVAADCFDERERLVLRFTTEVVEQGASPAAVEAMREGFSDREIVELVVAAGYYLMLARLMVTVGIDPDEPLGDEVVDSARRGRK
jgi:alkylhydroperoxidase family enzyme